jgi:hypothetical protein
MPEPIDTKLSACDRHDQETIDYFEKVMGDDTRSQIRIVVSRLFENGFRSD